MQEQSEFFRIYCHDNHKNCAELLPHIEEWLNMTVKTGYSPIELMFREKKHGIFHKMLPELKHNTLETKRFRNRMERAF
jgi:hypothetical protein